MEFVPGEAYEPKWDVSASPPAPEVVQQRARAAATMLAQLQAVDPEAVGFSSEVLGLGEELERWSQLFATAGGDLRGDERSLAQALARGIPSPIPPRILHGDYRMGNMQFDGDRLAAIIDWEIWSAGDPRIDLAWLMMFADPVQQRVSVRDAVNQAAADAMPPPETLLREYLTAAGAGAEPADMVWFHAFVCYKLGAAMSVLAKRNRRLPQPDPGLELAAATLPAMIAHGLQVLS
jgi:aminoglycoside phosphotransferase (APT) family kinase protein